MYARGINKQPNDNAKAQVNPPTADTEDVAKRKYSYRYQRQEQKIKLNIFAIENSDNSDSNNIVDDCDGSKENCCGNGNPSCNQSQYADGKSRIRGHRNGPAWLAWAIM